LASARQADPIDPETVRELVTLWFVALDHRRTEVLTGMCSPDVLIRPYIARQPGRPVEYRGHEGVADWVANLDSDARIKLDLFEIVVTGPQTAVVGTEVWLERGDVRRGGRTWSVWQFDDGKLREAVGYADKDTALAAA
jgi:ketosteroid isomerase-like protein